MANFYLEKRLMVGEDEPKRARPQLKNYGRVHSVPQPDENPDSTTSWTFYEHVKEAYMIDMENVARLAWNKYHRCFFYYIGRRNKAGTVSTVKFSLYEGKIIRDFIGKILDEIAAHPKKGRTFTDLIPFFDKDPTRANVSTEYEKRTELWADPDLELDTVRLRLIFNRVTGEYGILLNNMVSDAVSKRLKNWLGPQVTLGMIGVRNLEEYLTQVTEPTLEIETQVANS